VTSATSVTVPSLALCSKSTHLQMSCVFGNMDYVTKTFQDRAHVLRLLFKVAHLKMHNLRFCISLFKIRCRQASCRRLEQFSEHCGCAHLSKLVDIVIMSLASTVVPISKSNMDRTMTVRLLYLTLTGTGGYIIPLLIRTSAFFSRILVFSLSKKAYQPRCGCYMLPSYSTICKCVLFGNVPKLAEKNAKLLR
jgi:hypothetical protein